MTDSADQNQTLAPGPEKKSETEFKQSFFSLLYTNRFSNFKFAFSRLPLWVAVACGAESSSTPPIRYL
jgi:hypothetical protein